MIVVVVFAAAAAIIIILWSGLHAFARKVMVSSGGDDGPRSFDVGIMAALSIAAAAAAAAGSGPGCHLVRRRAVEVVRDRTPPAHFTVCALRTNAVAAAADCCVVV